jgi:hypothetical protein
LTVDMKNNMHSWDLSGACIVFQSLFPGKH